MALLGLIGGALNSIFGIVDKTVRDKDEAEKLKSAIQQQLLVNDAKYLESQANIIVAEAEGQSWLQRSWRPLTMLTFVVIVANNYILAPYVMAFGGTAPTLEIPPDMWQLIKIGLGGYVVGRSGEKIAKSYLAGKRSEKD